MEGGKFRAIDEDVRRWHRGENFLSLSSFMNEASEASSTDAGHKSHLNSDSIYKTTGRMYY